MPKSDRTVCQRSLFSERKRKMMALKSVVYLCLLISFNSSLTAALVTLVERENSNLTSGVLPPSTISVL